MSLRYSDFQVSEINEQGEIAKLTCKNPPHAPEEDAVSEDEDLLLSKYNLEILPMETWDKINTLAVNKDPDSGCVEVKYNDNNDILRQLTHGHLIPN